LTSRGLGLECAPLRSVRCHSGLHGNQG
jgi:hypothetical protein